MPKLSLDDVLHLQSNELFQTACSRMEKIERSETPQFHSPPSQLPKLNLSHLMDNTSARCKAIDSNRTLALGYYTRRLTLKAWKTIFDYKVDRANTTFNNKISGKRWKRQI